MKKIFTTLILLGVFTLSAQVKIGDNPTTIGSSSSLELESTNKALVLTRVANTAAVTAPVNGMIIYDISSNCIKAYENGVWTNCLSNGSNIEPSTNGTAKVNSYTCSTASAGTISVGVSVSGVTQTVTADVSQLGTYSLNCFANGVVFSGSGTFTALGSQNIVLTAIGTAENVGNDTYTLNTMPTCSFSRTAIGNPSSNGTAVVSAYTCNTASAGTPVMGTAVSGVTQTITATVTTAGTYSISATINGLTFTGTGTFAGTGAQTAVLTATGTPTTVGSNSFTLNTTPNCSFTRLVNSPTSGGTAVVSAYNCSGTSSGTLTVGTAASGVTQTITATVTTVGTYSITTTAENGITWSGSGTFAGTGAQTITLTASGTPTTAGTSTFALPSTPTCSFTRSVGETFTSTLCTTVGTFPATVTVGSSSVVVTKTGSSANSVAASTYCGITLGNAQQTADTQFATYSFNTPLKNLQVYGVSMESTENQEGYTVTASLAGVSVPVQLVPVAIGSCNSAFTSSQSGASASIRDTGLAIAAGIVFNISASGAYDSITITRVGTTGSFFNNHALAFCNATAVPNATSGGSAVVSAYNCSGTSTGAFAAGVPISGVSTQVITATVTTVGGYNITTTPVNGITWSGSGTFAGTGAQTITLTASGTPVAAGTSTFTLPTTPDCSFSRLVNEAFTSTLCTTVGTFPSTVTVGSSSVTITKTGTSTNSGSSTQCGFTSGNTQQKLNTQFSTYSFSVPVKDVQVYAINNESTENQEGYTVTASLLGVSVPVELVPMAIGSCNSAFTSTQSGASGSIRNMGLTAASGIAFNISASGAYDSITITRVGNASGTNAHSLALCNATAVPNVSSGGSAVVSAYSCSTASAGTMTSGTAVSGVTQTITATVTSVGTYNISTTNNGVTFAASGTFAGTGAQNIVLTATGTPTSGTASPYTYTLNTTPNCSFTRTVIQNIGSISCGTTTATFTNVLTGLAIPSGYTFSLPYTGGNSYAYPGATITSSSHSGVTATASAQTLNAGSGTILFTLSGTPATNGAISFNITVANQSCTYSGITAISRVVAFSSVTASTTTTIPAGINSVTVKAWGAAGKSTGGYYGGYGTYVKATVAVIPGENLTVKVGGGGTSGTTATNGGGSNGGGGYSGVFRSTTPLIIAGGGGGGSGNNDNVTPPNECTYIYGGSAGITNGFAGGKYAAAGVPQNTLLNTGGTQTAGGTGSDGTNGGSQYQGGSGLSGGFAGGGGGGGYYGGGGGTNRLADPTGDDGGGGGAGGSSFIAVGATDVTTGEQATCVSTNTVAAPGSTDTDYDAINTPAKPKNNSAGSNGRVVILYGY